MFGGLVLFSFSLSLVGSSMVSLSTLHPFAGSRVGSARWHTIHRELGDFGDFCPWHPLGLRASQITSSAAPKLQELEYPVSSSRCHRPLAWLTSGMRGPFRCVALLETWYDQDHRQRQRIFSSPYLYIHTYTYTYTHTHTHTCMYI